MRAWVSKLSYEDAAPPERWFNRAFLAAYAVAAALVLYAWFYIASACSKPQFQHRDEFSCPSTGRILSTWTLIGILMGTMFGSRFVLWRRLRAAYVPLLAVFVALGVVAAWLISHHARWGVPR
jgi:hypothetical protein